ncbi:unknown protein [Oryza sativa Japonica Group]|uniref:Uncharacterized protein P0413G02.22-2 n=2 Tax=Oryza sativa subsp. japonica TaxID=39947 RepID=Q5ZB00_ORYSJ|nr:unknown protein [Oryza sativa Japonica Group]
MAAPTVPYRTTAPPLPESDGHEDGSSGGMVLLDRWCLIADLPNASTGVGTTSTGLRIQATFHPARPPLLSRFCVHCPGLDFRRVVPKIIASDADLVLLCVPVNPDSIANARGLDYFVYRPRAHRLDLLPNPHPVYLHDSMTALLSRQDGAWYAVAALGLGPPVYKGGAPVSWDFYLHLYRSTSSSKGWTSKRLSVTEFIRDKFIPIPASVDRLYHETGKTITVGGEGGTVAWVDLWRGIFLCDVLDEFPALRDIPLPCPARSNRDLFLIQYDPSYFRDVTISRNRDSIKYIEMEMWSPKEPMNTTSTPVSYVDCVLNNTRKSQVIRDDWKATTWSMPMPVIGSSCEHWHRDCEVGVKDITLGASNPCRSNLSFSEIVEMFKELPMVNPTISMDDDVVFLLSRTSPSPMDKLHLVFAIDVRKRTLQGLTKLDVQPQNSVCMVTLCTSEICRYLRNITGNFSTLAIHHLVFLHVTICMNAMLAIFKI